MKNNMNMNMNTNMMKKFKMNQKKYKPTKNKRIMNSTFKKFRSRRKRNLKRIPPRILKRIQRNNFFIRWSNIQTYN